MSRTRHRWRSLTTAPLLAALLLVACGASDDTLEGIVRTPSLVVDDVSLPDVARGGSAQPMRAPAGELLLVYFGYTSCPDVCPTTLSDISVALEGLPTDRADRVRVAMVTVDPERDTDEVMVGYLAHFFDDGIPLRTDDPAALRHAADAFGVQWEVADHEADEAYDVAHTAMTYVVDDRGVVAVEWPFGFETDSMTNDLSTLLRKEST